VTTNLFPSLEAFTEVHRGLLQRYRLAGKLTPDLLDEVKRLLEMGSETGQVLDSLSDQRSAQGILDYWSAILHRGLIDVPEAVLAPFDPSTEPHLSDGDYPYAGRSSDLESGLLFGRDSLLREMLDQLRDDNFLAVIGPLGSGRSSLVQAGLLPALARGDLPGSETWRVYQVSPLDLNKLTFADDPVSIIVIDNCDDIFARAELEEQSKLAANVLALASSPGIRRIIVLILESDYEEKLAQFPDLEKRIKFAKVRVTSPTAKELHDAVERPAQRVGLKFEEGVVDQIVRNIVGEPAAFVLLQFTMRQLWKRRDHNKITRQALHEVGVGRTAIVRTAQRLFDGLSEKQRQLMRPLLVHIGSSTSVRLGAPPQLVPISWNLLVRSSADPNETEKLLQRLQDDDLIVVREAPKSGTSEKTVKLAHATLIENWEMLDGWLHEERKNREHRDRLRAKAQEWVRLGRRKDAGLLSEREILEAEDWLDSPEGELTDKTDDIWKLVEISKWRQKRELRSSRRIGAAFVVLSAALAVATGLMAYYWHASQLQKQLAQLNYIDLQILTLKFDAKTKAARISQLKRDEADAAKQSSNSHRAEATKDDVINAQQDRNKVLSYIATLVEDRSHIVKAILQSARLNSQLNEQQRKQLIEKLHNASLTPVSKLRIALYSVAAIPQNEELNKELRTSIVNARLRSTFEPPGSNQIWAVAFNPVDPKQAAVGDDHGSVWLWNPIDDPKGKNSRELSVAGDVVNGLAFSPDGTKLAAAYRKSGAVVWNLATDKVLCSLGHRPQPVSPQPVTRGLGISGYGGAVGSDANNYGVAFAPDGKTFAVAGERSVQLWDLYPEGCLPKSDPFLPNDDVFGVAFSRTGDLVAAASGDGKVTVWNLNQLDKHERKFSNKAIYAVAFSPTDSAVVAASAADGRGYVWNIETDAQIELPEQTGTVGQIAFSRNGKWLVATATDKGEVIVVDPRGNKLDQLGGSKNPIFGVAFSPDSKFLLTGDLGGVVSLWNIDADQGVSGDHDALIKLGAQHVGSLDLTENECKVLRETQIPIFALEVENFAEEASFLCPLSFLGDLPDVNMNDRVEKTVSKKTVSEELTDVALRASDKFPDLQTLLGIVVCSIVVVYLLARLAMRAK